MDSTHHNNSHRPVLLGATLELLAPKAGESYLDLTAGYGGHARAVLDRIGQASSMTLVDRDAEAIASLEDLGQAGAILIHKDFLSAARELAQAGKKFDCILLDLGVSSPQLESASRGFSFSRAGPLDMRMDQAQALSALEVVNIWPESSLADIIRRYGEEPHAERIARTIVSKRPFESTQELAEAVSSSRPSGKIHPATRTFQAIRIAVNGELEQLEQTLPLVNRLLEPGGRVAIISFHSLEDRIVKRYFQEEARSGYEATLRLLTKKPVLGSEYDESNPRARSAKLRAAAKIKT